MPEFIPSYTITEFKKLKVPEIKRLVSCEITADGEYLFTFTNAQTLYVRLHTEQLGMLSNNVKGEKLEQIISQEVTV